MRKVVLKILKSLENQKYQARTIRGIAKETKQTEEQVLKILLEEEQLREIIKVYPRRNKNNEILITTRSRFNKEATLLDKTIDILETKRRGLANELHRVHKSIKK